MLALEGSLFRYKFSPGALQAFESPVNHGHKRFVIYMGGLTDGLLACSYVEKLAAACDEKGWALVQPLISSAYAGYGCGSLDRDVAEIAECMSYLDSTRTVSDLAFVGHSTGCQQAVHLMATAPAPVRQKIRAVVLQAPVSDREAWSLEDDEKGRHRLLAEAQGLVDAGRPSALLSELHYGFVPMSASRYVSLFARGGADDLFSSDFSDDELASLLGHMSTRGQREGLGRLVREPLPSHPGVRVLFALSGADEYVPPSVDCKGLSERFAKAAGDSAKALVIEGANHNLQTPDNAADTFVSAVGKLLDEAIDRVFSTDADF